MTTETLKSKNGRRSATVWMSSPVLGTRHYVISLSESRRHGSSERERRVPTKKAAMVIAREWVGRLKAKS